MRASVPFCTYSTPICHCFNPLLRKATIFQQFWLLYQTMFYQRSMRAALLKQVSQWKPIISLGGFAYDQISKTFSHRQNMKTKHAHECKIGFHIFWHFNGGDESPMSKQKERVSLKARRIIFRNFTASSFKGRVDLKRPRVTGSVRKGWAGVPPLCLLIKFSVR